MTGLLCGAEGCNKHRGNAQDDCLACIQDYWGWALSKLKQVTTRKPLQPSPQSDYQGGREKWR